MVITVIWMVIWMKSPGPNMTPTERCGKAMESQKNQKMIYNLQMGKLHIELLVYWMSYFPEHGHRPGNSQILVETHLLTPCLPGSIQPLIWQG